MKRQNEDSSRAMHALVLASTRNLPIKKKAYFLVKEKNIGHALERKFKTMKFYMQNWLTSLCRYFVLLIIHWGKV